MGRKEAKADNLDESQDRADDTPRVGLARERRHSDVRSLPLGVGDASGGQTGDDVAFDERPTDPLESDIRDLLDSALDLDEVGGVQLDEGDLLFDADSRPTTEVDEDAPTKVVARSDLAAAAAPDTARLTADVEVPRSADREPTQEVARGGDARSAQREEPHRGRGALLALFAIVVSIAVAYAAFVRRAPQEPPSEPSPVASTPAIEPPMSAPIEPTTPPVGEPGPEERASAPPPAWERGDDQDEEPESDTAKPEPTVERAQRSPAQGRSSRSKRARRPADTSKRGSELPDVPTRAQVVHAVNSVRPALRECAGGRGGVARADLKVASSGRVIHALVSGDYSGTDEGSCIARALRGAEFPRFQQDTFRVLYPIAL